LAQGGTSQSLGAVTITGGALQLTGGATPAATDVTTASTWAGALTAASAGEARLDTVLGTDGSPSDVLNISGAITGTTLLRINTLGGAGAQTTGNGIRVVQGSAANASAPAASFALAAPVIDNGFEYTLKKTGNDWYLVSSPYKAGAATTPVPALSWLGLLALSALLAAGAPGALRRRRFQ
jgi:outer membrane autotransporter protein